MLEHRLTPSLTTSLMEEMIISTMMKKSIKWLLVVTLVSSAGVFTACTSVDDNSADRPESTAVVIDETNFPDAHFRRFLLEQDYGKDGMLTNAEIAGITVMDVAEEEIASLKGIEHFTALDTLDCSGNELAVLDVSGNTALRQLDCSFNDLSALDVSKNRTLEVLFLSFNHIASLDVSKNTALKELACHYNCLTSIELSSNAELEYLLCNSNRLARLDVSKCAKLATLLCSSNQLTALDLSHNMSLAELSCPDNELTTLVVSRDAPLSKLYFCRNKISGKPMDELISSLPQNTSSEIPRFIAVDHREGDEGNVLTKSQSDAVKAKGWSPQYWEENEGTWKEFD